VRVGRGLISRSSALRERAVHDRSQGLVAGGDARQRSWSGCFDNVAIVRMFGRRLIARLLKPGSALESNFNCHRRPEGDTWVVSVTEEVRVLCRVVLVFAEPRVHRRVESCKPPALSEIVVCLFERV